MISRVILERLNAIIKHLLIWFQSGKQFLQIQTACLNVDKTTICHAYVKFGAAKNKHARVCVDVWIGARHLFFDVCDILLALRTLRFNILSDCVRTLRCN